TTAFALNLSVAGATRKSYRKENFPTERRFAGPSATLQKTRTTGAANGLNLMGRGDSRSSSVQNERYSGPFNTESFKVVIWTTTALKSATDSDSEHKRDCKCPESPALFVVVMKVKTQTRL